MKNQTFEEMTAEAKQLKAEIREAVKRTSRISNDQFLDIIFDSMSNKQLIAVLEAVEFTRAESQGEDGN